MSMPVDPFSLAPLPDDEVERALVVVAHPDDAEFGAAGTIASWTDVGIKVTVLCCTHGEQGARPDADIIAIPALRDAEQRAASAQLGVTDVRFLDGFRDGWLEPSFDLQREIVRVIRQVRPQRVLTQSPERWYRRLVASHPDHLAAGEATIRACYPAAENPFAWPELGLDFWKVGEIWLMAHPDGHHPVDTTAYVDRKVAALRAHVSQTGHRVDLEESVVMLGQATAARFDLPAGTTAEAFGIVPVNRR